MNDIEIYNNIPYICISETTYRTDTNYQLIIKELLNNFGQIFCIYKRSDIKGFYLEFPGTRYDLIEVFKIAW